MINIKKNKYYNLYLSIINAYEFCIKMEHGKSRENKRKIIIKKRIRYKRKFKDLKVNDKIISINIIKNNFYDLKTLNDCNPNNFQSLEILLKIYQK